jgi:hypothetical protein
MPEPPGRPPIAQSPLSVVLVVDRPEPGVSETIKRWVTYLDSLNREYRILLLYDRRTPVPDLSELAASPPRSLSVEQCLRDGFGAALRHALESMELRIPLLVYAPCSPAYQPEDLASMLDVIDDVDLVSGDRTGHRRHFSRTWREWAFHWLTRLVFGVRLRDSGCPFKLFRRTIFERIPIQSDGSFVHAEILAKANFLGCVMTEVPVGYQPTADTERATAATSTWREAWQLFRKPDFGPSKAGN